MEISDKMSISVTNKDRDILCVILKLRKNDLDRFWPQLIILYDFLKISGNIYKKDLSPEQFHIPINIHF